MMRPRLFSLALLLFGIACMSTTTPSGQVVSGISVDVAATMLRSAADSVELYDANRDGVLSDDESAALVTELVAEITTQILLAATAEENTSAGRGGPREPIAGGLPVATVAKILRTTAQDVETLDVSPHDGILDAREAAAIGVRLTARIAALAMSR